MSSFYQKILCKSYSLIENTFFKQSLRSPKPNTLLIVKVDSIGDYVLFRNFIQEIKNSDTYKNHRITLCGNSWWKDLAENLDASVIDNFIWIDYSKLNDCGYWFRLHKKIFFSRFETVIQSTFSRDRIGDDIVKYSAAKKKIGSEGDLVNLTALKKKENDETYTRLIPSAGKYMFEFNRNKHFFEQVLNKKIAISKPSIASVHQTETKIIFFPGAKDTFRRWSTGNFAALSKKLKSDFPAATFVICGSAQDTPMAKEIIALSTVSFTDLTGKLSLMQLVAELEQAKLVIANDSGPFHIAVALNKKVICISNGNNYSRFTPYPEEMKTQSIVIYPDQITARSEQERREQFCREVKEIDINNISVEQVYLQVKEMKFN